MTALRIGIVGAGYWGAKLVRVFDATADVLVHTVCDHDIDRCAALSGNFRIVASAGDLLHTDDIDAVAIATPPATHYALARDVLDAGKHCWVEKPMALRAAEAHDLVARAQRAGLTLFVDETFLYDPLLQRAREWIRAGRLGRLYHLSFERLGMGRIRRDSDVWWNSGPHDLAILLYLVSNPVESIRLDGFDYVQRSIADVASATITLGGGVSAHIYVSWLSPLTVASIVAVGSGGMLHYEGRFGQRVLRYFRYALADPHSGSDNVLPITSFENSETLTGGAEEPLALAAQAFIESVRSGVPAASAGAYSQRVVELLEAAGASRSPP